MASFRLGLALATIFLLVIAVPSRANEDDAAYRTYIVFLSPPADVDATSRSAYREWHESFLPSTLTESGETRLVCSYSKTFHGFAARLTDAELAEVAKLPGFQRAIPDGMKQPLTTRTPLFLGLTRDDDENTFWNAVGYGRGVVIGIVDSGIYGKHASFRDDGVPEPPARWNGTCTGSEETKCNRKLVGSKSFVHDGDPEDNEEIGHGTHVAGIAAGNFVEAASLSGGLAKGRAAGIAPLAHIAVYKVCTVGGCPDSSISCGIEEAVHDGVDVINLSLGGSDFRTFDMDPTAIGAFQAMANGIVVVSAACNDGPRPSTICNDAPWMLTVGAGSVDRQFDAKVETEYGESTIVTGETLVQDRGLEGIYPLVNGDTCVDDVSDIAGKMVICTAVLSGQDLVSIIERLQRLGAAGVLLIDLEVHGYTTLLNNYTGYNVIKINSFQGRHLIDYAKSLYPSARIYFNGVVEGGERAPVVAYFSSRGPSKLSPGVLKPDVLAPGLNIISASSSRLAPRDGWSSLFKVMSGTSMAAPHISGVVALLKNAHPDWSPAAIKSAILTTASTKDSSDGAIRDEQHEDAPYFAMGAGHVNPSRAADPGLVYDLGARDYASYICGLLGQSSLTVLDQSLSCSEVGSIPEAWLNLPTIMVPLRDTPVTVPRMLTNVGPAETYTASATVRGPRSMDIRVSPDTLVFSKPGEKQTFNVTVMVNDGKNTGTADGDFIEASLIWKSTNHLVRSPVVAVRGLPDHGL